MMVNLLIREALTCQAPRPRYAYLAPQYGQAKDIAWDYLKQYTARIPGMRYNEAELRADFPNEARIRLWGATNADALRGPYLDGIVLDEYAFMDPDVWAKVIRPTLSDRKGFAIFIGTPLGHNDFYVKYQRAQATPGMLAEYWPASRTGHLDADELAQALADVGPDAYAQEYECSFEAAIAGAYYARQLEQVRAEGRIRTVPWLPATPVDTWWDLGFNDATAIIFTQRAGREVHVIDYLETSGQELAYYAKELQRRPYTYGDHVLPHDADQQEIRTGTSIADMLRGMRLPGHVRVLPQADIQPGIEAARKLFPRCWFDATKCARLIEALSHYRPAWDAKAQTYRDKPLHDWASHGADAFRYLAAGFRDTDAQERPRSFQAKTVFDPLTYNRPGARAFTTRYAHLLR